MSISNTNSRLEKWHLPALMQAWLGLAFITASSGSSGSVLANTPIWGTYAIQSVLTEKNLRPYQANKADGTKIVLYKHWRWKCMTWQFVQTERSSYRLVNRYTGKTFQADTFSQPEIQLHQQIPGGSVFQEWDFQQQHDGSWMISLHNTGFYLTALSTNNNSPVVLMPETGSDAQKWKLLAQDPWL